MPIVANVASSKDEEHAKGLSQVYFQLQTAVKL